MDIVTRLREWSTVYPEDEKGDGALYQNARAADRVASMSEDKARRVAFEVVDGEVRLSVQSAAGSGDDVIDAIIQGEGISTAFNSAYIRETLSQAEGGDVTIEYGVAGQPVLMKTLEDSGFMAVIMPMR